MIALMAGTAGDGQVVTVDGRAIKLTNLSKVLYPETGTTKGEVLAYYAEIGPFMLPHIADRPVTRKRWPDGVGVADDAGTVFFQKNLAAGTPDWVQRRTIEHHERSGEYPLVNDLATLTWLAQLAALEIHVPQWKFDPEGQSMNPDRLVLDLDPGPGAGILECAEVARQARAILAEIGHEPYPITSGSKGIHLYAPLDGKLTSHESSTLARELAQGLEAANPDLVISNMKRTLRDGKVFVDWSQNSASKTTIAPYSLRGRVHPMVAAPRTWEELDDPDLRQLNFEEVLERVREQGDLIAELDAPFGLRERDRLSTYRSMRDPHLTPEPVPATPPAPSEGQTFVIQEHHARNLHWDFRLEHDGVLVSWALPKGVPTEREKNHLAVQTEDHPLEYGSFEGSIPRGEYGGGEVTIWDAGTYELEKWRDGKEVIATLHGRPDGGLGGPRKFALIHTGGRNLPERSWLIHLMRTDAPTQPKPNTTSKPTKINPPTMINRDAYDGQPIEPMLATLARVGEFGDQEGWAYEMKWDGVRVIAYLRDGEVQLLSRRGRDETTSYPEIAEALRSVPATDAVLDGEIVALDETGRPQFGLLQHRINLSKPADVARARAETPVQVMLFDLMVLNGRSLLKAPYAERHQALIDLSEPGLDRRIHVPPSFDGDLEAALETSAALQLEGVVAKRLTAPYTPGRRAGSWLKLKHHRTQEVVIGGWRLGRGRRDDTIGSLLVGIPDGDELRYIGRVGSGFGDQELTEIRRLVDEMVIDDNPFVGVPREDTLDATWIDPILVGEVVFSGWTDDGRLWHPTWRGWRVDKAPSDVVRES